LTFCIMANEKQANEARRRHGRALLEQGAHAVGVEEGKSYGRKGFVIVAHVPPRTKSEIPSSLTFSTEHGDIEVPVVVEHSEPFTPE
jgi:hypothetical protein